MARKKQKRQRIFILNDPHALRISGELAQEIGLNESIILLQLEFLISIASHKNFKDGRWWTYQSVRDLQENYFPWWSHMTINRTLQSLEEAGYIIVGNYNKRRNDKTRWISLNYDKLRDLKSIQIAEHERTMVQEEPPEPPSKDKRAVTNCYSPYQNVTAPYQNVTTLPETTPETTHTHDDEPVSMAEPEPEQKEVVCVSDDLIQELDTLFQKESKCTPKKTTKKRWYEALQSIAEDYGSQAEKLIPLAIRHAKENWTNGQIAGPWSLFNVLSLMATQAATAGQKLTDEQLKAYEILQKEAIV